MQYTSKFVFRASA